MGEVSTKFSMKMFFMQLGEWLAYLKSKIVLLTAFLLCGAAFGIAYSLLKKVEYISTSTFVLEENSKGGGLGQYANLANMVGIDIGGSKDNGIFQGDNILELYKSRAMIVKTLLTPAQFSGGSELLVTKYIAIHDLKNDWDKTDPAAFNFNDPLKISMTQDSVLSEIAKEIRDKELIVVKPDKKLGIIKVEVKSHDQLFAKNFNDKIVENVNDFYVATKTKKSSRNVAILQREADSVRAVLDNAIRGVATSIDFNPNPNPARQILKVPSQKRQIDAEASRTILTELVKNLALAKISLLQETPLIQIVDKPVLPLGRTKYPVIKFALLGGGLFLITGILALLIRRFFKLVMA